MQGFKVRLVVAFLLGVLFSGLGRWGATREVMAPFFQYLTKQHYDLNSQIRDWWYARNLSASHPVMSQPLRPPCEYRGIARHFGWYYNARTQGQEFNPGVVLSIEDEVPVYPMLPGRVAKIERRENRYEVVIVHGEELVSCVRGLNEIEVRVGQKVAESTLLGRASDILYLEMRNKEEPINIEGYLTSPRSL